MQLLVAALIGGLIQALGTIVGRILISLGIGFVTYQGVTTALDFAKGLVVSNLQGMPADIVNIASLTQIDTAVSIIFSAIATRLVIQGLTSGAMKKMVVK